MAVLNDYLTSVGVTLLSLRTRASLEERYWNSSSKNVASSAVNAWWRRVAPKFE